MENLRFNELFEGHFYLETITTTINNLEGKGKPLACAKREYFRKVQIS